MGPPALPWRRIAGQRLVVFNARCEYFYSANFNDVVGYLPLGKLLRGQAEHPEIQRL